jgi:hypothetical protein
MRFYKYSIGDVLKLSPILYNGEFVNSIPFISFYDNSGTIFRVELNSKFGEILSSFKRIHMDQQHKYIKFNFVEKCLSSIDSNGEKFFIILPISVYQKSANINKRKNNNLHIDLDYALLAGGRCALSASKIIETDEINDLNKIEESKYDIDDWFGTYKNNEKMLDFFKNNYKEIYLKYIENEREYKLNYLFEK